MSPQQRDTFDGLLDAVVSELPASITALLEEKPVVVEDHPSAQLLAELGLPPEAREELCGLHSGPMETEITTDGGPVDIRVIHLFREGIIAAAGGWLDGPEAVQEEIRITLLHEIGHHFGLNEEDLQELGYG